MRRAVNWASMLVTGPSIVVIFYCIHGSIVQKRQCHSALTRKSDTGHRPPHIDLISHRDTNADMPLVCCLPSMTWTTCVPCLAWRRGTHFVYPNSWSRPPERQTDKAVAAGAGDALPTLFGDVKRQGQWPLIFRFYFHLQDFTLTSDYLILTDSVMLLVFCEHQMHQMHQDFKQSYGLKKKKNYAALQYHMF